MLGYPTMAGSEHLPAGGFNAEGIPPDVRIGPEVTDAIQFIVDYYAKGSKPTPLQPQARVHSEAGADLGGTRDDSAGTCPEGARACSRGLALFASPR